jgi:coproporphyrinogen III oxidase
MNTEAVKTYLLSAGTHYCCAGGNRWPSFISDSWERPEGGGGISRVIEEGHVFERGGVNFPVMGSNLPPSAAASRPELAGRKWEAMGVSLVLHPRNPYAPTVHMNVRFFTTHAEGQSGLVVWRRHGSDTVLRFREDAAIFIRPAKTH